MSSNPNTKSNNDYKIEPIDTEKSEIPQKACAKRHVLPPFPFSMIISGRSGSGKTVALMNILTKKSMYGKYFHYILVFSPTAGKYDDTYKVLGLPKENFIHDLTPESLNDIIEARKKLIDDKGIKWVARNRRVCIILDDIIANRNFLHSPEALVMFSLLRHYLCSVIILIQSYTKVPRALRIQANATIIFPSQRNEVEIIKDELTPPGLSKKEFEKVISHCCEDRHSFFYVNQKAPPNERIRKNLTEVINLADYKK